jgi:hypothetical protein
MEDEMRMDYALAEQDLLNAGHEMISKYPEVGALVLECHNMAPFSRALNNALGIPVYDVYTFVTWFHSGLYPRDFGWPGSGELPGGWRER